MVCQKRMEKIDKSVQRYGPDQRYFRAAVILRPNPVDVEVYCIDYGMKITLPVGEIAQLADEFTTYAPQAVAIQIKGIAESRMKMTLDMLKKELEKKDVTIRLEAQLGDKYLVTMTINDENGMVVDVAHLLTDQQRMTGLPPSGAKMSPSASSCPSSSPAVVDIALRPEESGDRQQLLMVTNRQRVETVPSDDIPTLIISLLPKTEQVVLRSSECSSHPSSPPAQMSTSSTISKIDSASFPLPVHEKCLRSDDYDAGNPSRFYVQLDRFIDKVLEIKAAIKTPTTPLREPTIGAACIANYDGDWYRAEVIAINGETITVQYVDYGNVEDKRLKEVFAITDEQPDVIRETHKLAIPCKLFNIEPVDGASEWSSQSVDLFNAAFREACVLDVDIIGREDDQVFLVDLKIDGNSLSESLVAQEAARKSSDAAIITKIEPAVISIPLLDSAVRSDALSDELPLCCYIHLSRFFDKAQQMLTAIMPPTVLLKTPTIGTACIANYSGDWYRGEIIAVREDSVTVRYVDYGNTEDKRLNEIYAISSDQPDFVRNTPKLAFPCKVLSIEGKEWPSSCPSLPMAFPDDGSFQVHVIGQEGEMLLVNVVNGKPLATQSSQIENEIVTEKSATDTENKMETEEATATASDSVQESRPPTAVTVTKIESAVVTAAVETVLRSDDGTSESPLYFSVQLERFADKLQQMLTEIKPPTVLLEKPDIGVACIANFMGDWYRAEVIAVSGEIFTIQYVDYGNVEEKKKDKLFAITNEQPEVIRLTHKLAISCKWFSSEEKKLPADSAQTAFKVAIKGKEGELLLVELEDVAGEEVAAMKIAPPVIALPVKEMCALSDELDDDISRSWALFYVQLHRFAHVVQQMNDAIKFPTTRLHTPTIGAACLANFLGLWCRAEIVAINGETIAVQYVDYGNVEERELNELFAITDEQPEIVRVTPKLAIPCKLFAVEPIDGNSERSSRSMDLFNVAFQEVCVVEVDIIGRDDDHVFLVDLKVDGNSLSESLRAQNAAKKRSLDAAIVTKIEPAIVSIPLLDTAVRSDAFSDELPLCFYIHLSRFFDKAQQMLTAIKPPTVLLNMPTIGAACIANYSGDWYRGEIIAVREDSVTVRYVDYGNTEDKRLNEIYAISSDQPDFVRNTPKLAFSCKVLSIEGKEWPSSCPSLPMTISNEDTFQVHVIGQKGELLLVQLENGAGEEVTAMKIAPPVIAFPVEEMCARSDELDDDISRSWALFYVQLHRFSRVVQQMNDAIKLPTTPLHFPIIGTACIANYLGIWCRAEIVAINGETIAVQYVDYGNVEEKGLKELFAITDEQPEIVRVTPKLAIPCKSIGGELEKFPMHHFFLVNIKEKDGELYLVDVKEALKI